MRVAFISTLESEVAYAITTELLALRPALSDEFETTWAAAALGITVGISFVAIVSGLLRDTGHATLRC